MQSQHEPARTDLERVQALLRSPRVGGNARLRLVDLEQRLKAGFLSSESRQRIRDLYKRFMDQPVPETVSAASSESPLFSGAVQEACGESDATRLQQRVVELERRLAATPEPGGCSNGTHADEILALRRRLEAAEEAARSARSDAERAEQRLAQRRASANHEANRKIRRIKRIFALHFHPDHVNATGLERDIRETVFKDFWGELDKIEREDLGE